MDFEMKHKFKIGDSVRVLVDKPNCALLYKDDIVKVVECRPIEEYDLFCVYTVDNGWGVCENNIELMYSSNLPEDLFIL